MNFLADIALRSSLVLAFVLVLQWGLKRVSAAERYWVILLGVVVVALIPVGRALSPHIPWTINVALPETKAVKLAAEPIDATDDSPAAVPENVSRAVTHPVLSPGFELSLSKGVRLLLIMGALSQCVILAGAAFSWRRIRGSTTPVCLNAAFLEQVRSFAGEKGVPPVLASDEISVPVLAGWLRPVVILPRAALAGSDTSLSMMVCHEIAHYRRGDSYLLPLHWLLRIIYWWHPLVWLALARLRREREMACDDLVLGHNFRPTDYAGLLVSAAREAQAGPRALPWVLAMAAHSCVGDRITSILDNRVRRRTTGGWITIPGTLAAFCLTWPIVATQFNTADEDAAAYKAAAFNLEASQIKLSYSLVLIDYNAYQQDQAEMDAAVATGDPAIISRLPGAYVQSTSDHLAEVGKEFHFEDVRPMTFNTQFQPDDFGDIVPSAPHSQNLGPRFTNVATVEPDHQSVRLRFKCSLTYFKQWRELPNGGQRPVFGKKTLWTTRSVHHGHALWEVPGANRYLPPDNFSANPFGGNWPVGKDTGPKKMFILVNAAPATPDDRGELVADAHGAGASVHP